MDVTFNNPVQVRPEPELHLKNIVTLIFMQKKHIVHFLVLQLAIENVAYFTTNFWFDCAVTELSFRY